MATYKELLAKAEQLTREAEEMRLKEMGDVIANIKSQMADYGITIEDLQPKTRGRATGKSLGKVADKYAKDGHTWTGRGKPPHWVKEHMAAGGSMNDLLINKNTNSQP